MRKRDCLKVLLLLPCFSNAYAEVRITEIMTSNEYTIVSEKYNYDGYVEFYNDGNSIDLKGWTVTNIKEGETDWSLKLDSTHVIPNGYSLLFFGKTETSSTTASKYQSNYVGRVGHKLSTDEGKISLEKDGQKIELAYPAQHPHLSYCEDGFMMPTPGKENDKLVTDIKNRVSIPTFKTGEPGFHENSLTVELDCPTDGATIYYTLTGDVPTPDTCKVYTGPITIDEPTVVRARAYKDGMLFSETLTGSFILPDKFHNDCKNEGKRLPIVSLTGNFQDIFGDMLGFYVDGKNGIPSGCYTTPSNYNQDWTRCLNFEYILDGKVVDNQEIEAGVYGGCTRTHVARSLKLKANKRTGKKRMDYKTFFPSRSYTKYKSLALRNGGNGYMYIQPRWRDMYMQSLADGMNIDRQAAQPVAYYLNGQFYGMMILTERTDEDYIYHNYGLDEDEIDLFSCPGGYVCEKGTTEAYQKMINYVSKSYNNEDFYDQLNTHMDIDEYMDYQILEQFVGNTDWVTNNTKLWRKHDGGRFRWIVYDTDFGFSPKSSRVDTCMLDFTTTLMKSTAYEAAILLQKSCMKNEDFRWRFLDQYLDRIEHQFCDERLMTKFDSIRELTELEMCATIKNAGKLKCPGKWDYYVEEVENMRSFALARKDYVIDQLKKAYGLGDEKITIKIRSVFPNDERPEFSFLLNKREFNEEKFNMTAFINERIKVEPKIPYGYKLQKWAINNKTVRTNDGQRFTDLALTTVADSSEYKVTIYFEYDTKCVLPENLHLNEICAQNASTIDENGETSDWIELYNGNDKDVDFAGLTISNETKGVHCILPEGSKETVIPAHGYKLLWADKHPEIGPLHLNFKLGVSDTGKIVLHRYYHDKDVELSSITYEPHSTDESYGRITDGATTIQLFAKCTDEDGNEIITATPNSENGSVICPSTQTSAKVAINAKKFVYAEGKNVYVQNAKGKDVRIYTMLGDLVSNQKSNAETFSISVPVPDIYLVKVGKECWKVVVE